MMNGAERAKSWLHVLPVVGVVFVVVVIVQASYRPANDAIVEASSTRLNAAIEETGESFQRVASVPAYQAGPWVRTGGPIGGLGYDIRYHFGDPNLWYVTDAWSGIHMSTDRGMTWFPSNDGITARYGTGAADAIPIFSATVDPLNPNIVWIGSDKTGDIFKSVDGGHTWVEKTNGITTTAPLSFRGFTVDPTSSTIVYAMGEIGSPGWTPDGSERTGLELDMTKGIVYKTTDGGENWTQIWYGDNLARYCWIDPRDPENQDDDVLFVSTGIFDREAANTDVGASFAGGVGILKSTDSGQTWTVIDQANGLLDLYVGSLYMHPSDPDVLLAAAGQNNWSTYGGADTSGVFLTEDGGISWTRVVSGELLGAVEYCPNAQNVAYAAGDRAAYRSEDGGHTWQRFNRPDGYWGPPGVVAGFPIDMQCDPLDPLRVFVNNYQGGNFLSTDGGVTWSMASNGYTGAHVYHLTVAPNAPWTVYTGGPSGMFRSQDSGGTWMGLAHSPAGTSAKLNMIDAIAANPLDPNHVLGFPGDVGRVVYSHDGGQSWMVSSGTTATVAAIAFVPSAPSIVYAAVSPNECMGMIPGDRTECDKPGLGLYVSADSGASWEPAGGQAIGHGMRAVAVHPYNANIVYAGTYVTGVLKTVDGGATWAGGTGLPDMAIRSVAIDPADPNIVFAGTDGGGIYRSVDGGVSWTPASIGLHQPQAEIHSIVVDPTNGQVVYAADFNSGVYVSTDGGDTWNPLNDGLVHRSAGALGISGDGTVLYVGIIGDGVYRLGTPASKVYLPLVLNSY